DRRAHQLEDRRSNPLLRELQRTQRVFHALAFDQVQHQSRLLRRDACEIRFGFEFHISLCPSLRRYALGAAGRAAPPAGAEGPIAPGPPGTPAGFAAASAAAFTECPLNWRGDEKSPPLCPPHFPGIVTRKNIFPLVTPTGCPPHPRGVARARAPARTSARLVFAL